jgi:hypothetical protein
MFVPYAGAQRQFYPTDVALQRRGMEGEREREGGIGHAYFYFTTTSFSFKKTHFFRLKSQIKSQTLKKNI